MTQGLLGLLREWRETRVQNVLAAGRAGSHQESAQHIGAEEVLVELIDLIGTRLKEEAL